MKPRLPIRSNFGEFPKSPRLCIPPAMPTNFISHCPLRHQSVTIFFHTAARQISKFSIAGSSPTGAFRRSLLQAKQAWFDRDQPLIRQFRTGVSIHSHTSRSKEGLEFVGRFFESNLLLRTFIRMQEKAAHKRGLPMDFSQLYWTPPLCPRSAYEVEKNQIEQTLGMRALVSLSDHDCIEAPLLLRVVPAMQDTPVSLEWTVPFQTAKFHLGVHNLPGAHAPQWLNELKACTAQPSTERVCDLLQHPARHSRSAGGLQSSLWNLYSNPVGEFARNLEDFLALNNGTPARL